MSLIERNEIQLNFNHSDFKKNTQECIDILNNLKSKVEGEATFKPLDKLVDSTKKFNLSKMADSIDVVGKRMRLMGIVGASVINKLTNNAVDSGIKIAKALPQQIIQGGWNRAQNIEKAQFLIEGLGYTWKKTGEKIEGEINDVFDAVDSAVQGTAYGLDEAALVASNFISSGVTDLKELNKALKSVSGLASVVSADYGDIGRIYAQVAGQGRMMGDDLLQLSQRGIGAASEIAKYLNVNRDVAKQATDTAIAQGKQVKKMEEIQKHAKITEADVREMVSAGAISFDILVGATEKFFEQAQKANDTYSGSLSNLKSAFNRLGETFEGNKLKNLTRIFNALIPVVKRLKVIMEPFINVLNNMSNKATDMAVKGIKTLAKAMGVDFKTDENKGFFRFAKGLSRFKEDVTKTNKDIEKGNKDIAHSVTVTMKEWQAALDIWYKGSYGTGQKRAEEIRKLGMSYENVQGIINKFYKNEFDWEKTKQEVNPGKRTKEQEENNKAVEKGTLVAAKQKKELSALGKTVKGVMNLIRAFGNVVKIAVSTGKALKNIFKDFGNSAFGSFAKAFLNASRNIKNFTGDLAKTMQKISKFRKGYVKLANNGSLLANTFRLLGGAVSTVGLYISKVGFGINKVVKTFVKAAKAVKNGNEDLGGLGKTFKGILNLKEAIINFVEGLVDLFLVLENLIGTLKNELNASGIGTFFTRLGDKLGSAFLFISEKILAASKKFETFTGALLRGRMEIERISGKGTKFAKVLDSFKKLGTQIKDAFKQIGQTISDKTFKYFDKIENAFKQITGLVSSSSGAGFILTLFERIGSVVANFLTGLATGESVAGSFFSTLGSFAHEFLGIVSKAFEWVLDHIGPAIEKIVDFFKELSKSEGFDKLKNGLHEALEAMTRMAQSNFDKVVSWFKEIGSLTFNNGNMMKMVDFFSDLAGGVGDFFSKISKGENPMRTFFDTFNKTKEVMSFKYQAKKSIGDQFSELVNAPALGASLNELKKMDAGGKSLEAANNLTNLGESLAEGLSGDNLDAITGKYFKDIKEGNWDKVSKVALRIVSIGALIKSTKDFADLTKSIAGISGSISGFFKSLSGIADSIQKGIRIESFRTMAVAVALIAASIAVLAVIPKEKMLPAAAVILSFMGMMLAVMKITTRKEFNPRNMLDVGLAFAGMGAGMLLIAGAVAKMGKLDPGQLFRGASAVVAFMGAMILVSRFAHHIVGVGATFIGMALAVTALVGAVGMFAKMDPSTFADGMTRIVIGMVSLALAARIAGRGAKGCASFFAIAAALYALIPAIILMALIPMAKAIQGAATISLVMIALGTAARIAQSGDGFKSMAAMASTIGVLTASLVILSFINPSRLANAVLALMGVISTIALGSAIMKEAKAAALMMVAVIAAITGAIVLLVKLDAQGAIAVAMGLAAFATAMALACAACAAVGLVGPAAFIGIGVMAAVIAAVTGIIVALGALAEHEGFMKKVDSFEKFMGKLGNTIGQFGAGMASGMADNLGDSAAKLKEFTDVFIPLVNSLSSMDTEGVKALKDLAEAVLMITGGGILDKVGSKFNGGNKENMAGFGESLDSLAESFIPFVRKLSSGEGIGKAAIEKVRSFGDAVKVFADVAGALPKTSKIKFGLFKGTFGEVEDLDEFADDVKKAAKSIGKAADNSEDFDQSKVNRISRVGDAITTLSNVAKKLPKVGAWPTLSGKNDLGAFAKDLGTFVPNFKTFSDACGKAGGEDTFGNLSRVQNVADSVTALANAAKSIPTNVSGFHPIKGKKEIGDFASDLASFVPSFKTFSDACGRAGDEETFGRLDRVKNVAASVKAMAEAAEIIPKNIGGGAGASLGAALSGSDGGGGLTKFADDLSAFVTPFYKFSYNVAKHSKVFSEDNLSKVGLIGTALSKLADVKAKIAEVVGQAGGSLFGGGTEDNGNLESFGGELESLSSGLKTFITKTKDLDEGEIEEAKTKVQAVAKVFNALKQKGVTGEGEFKIPDASQLVDFATNMKEFGTEMTGVEVDEQQFSAIATYLDTFRQKLANIDVKDVTAKAKVVQKVGNAVTKFNEVGDIPTGKNLVTLSQNVATFVDNLADKETAGIAKKATQVKNAMKKLVQAAKAGAGEAGGGNGMKSAGSNIAKTYIKGITDKAKDAKTAGEKLTKNAKDGANKQSYVNDFKNIGKNLGQGLADGLSSKYSAVSVAAEKIISKANEAARAAAEINSPSKLFARIGSGLGEGLVLGMNRYHDEVYDASYKMSSMSVQAANLALQGLDEVASPTITPVIDLSNVRRGANAINAMVSSSKAIDINASVNSSASRYATPGMVSKLFDKVNAMSSKGVNVNISDGKTGAQIVNHIVVDGAENPEDFANRFVRQLEMEMRTV